MLNAYLINYVQYTLTTTTYWLVKFLWAEVAPDYGIRSPTALVGGGFKYMEKFPKLKNNIISDYFICPRRGPAARLAPLSKKEK